MTLADQASAGGSRRRLDRTGPYRSAARFDRVVLLEERERRWHPLADACLGPPAVVGRGGLELEIIEGRMLGPDVLAMAESQHADLDDVGDQPGWLPSLCAEPARWPGHRKPGHRNARAIESIVLTGRRQGQRDRRRSRVAGRRVGEPVNCVLVEAGARRQGVGRAWSRL